PSLANLVVSYVEAGSARMSHLLTPTFAVSVARALVKMSANLEVLRLAHSLTALHALNDTVVPMLARLRSLRVVDLYDYPMSINTGLAPNTSLKALHLHGSDMRANSSSAPAPHFLKRLVYQSYEDLQVLRLTMCSVSAVLEACQGITWDRVHTLGLDDCYIPDLYTTTFPNIVTLEIWSAKHAPKRIPVYGWHRLTTYKAIVASIGWTAHAPQDLHSGPRVVSRLDVDCVGTESLGPDQVVAALSCVVPEKLEHLRIGYCGWGDRSLARIFANCRGISSLALELRMREARNYKLLFSIDKCIALQHLLLIFREQEAMAEFENRFLQNPNSFEDFPDDSETITPSKIPARTAFGTPFARLHRDEIGPRGKIPRPREGPGLFRRIVLSLRSGSSEDDCEEEEMRRTWEFDDIYEQWTLVD
ncbi:hypothetical protein EXIGLDRAFT_718629, partial [Exidia glandulosa HHB12029]